MLLIVGLGNPGKKYEHTRHNAGFMAINEFAKENNLPDFKFVKEYNAEISGGILNGEKNILAKPRTFMNNSGKTVGGLIKNYKLKTINLIVIHDDIDLPLGQIKIVQNRGSAGHKGVESIIKELGSKNFIRLRIGIKPQKKEGGKRETEKLVLQKFTGGEEKLMREIILKTAEALGKLTGDGLEKIMQVYNQ